MNEPGSLNVIECDPQSLGEIGVSWCESQSQVPMMQRESFYGLRRVKEPLLVSISLSISIFISNFFLSLLCLSKGIIEMKKSENQTRIDSNLNLYNYHTFTIRCLKDKYWCKVINNVFCKRIRVGWLFCWSSDQRLELRWMRSSGFSSLDVYFPKYCISNFICVIFYTWMITKEFSRDYLQVCDWTNF